MGRKERSGEREREREGGGERTHWMYTERRKWGRN